jgi:hypothetical protein
VCLEDVARLRTNEPSRIDSGSRMVPTRSVARSDSRKESAAVLKSADADMVRCASGSSAAPASVSVKPPGVRLKSCSPVLSSSPFNCRLTAGWVRCSKVAARDTVPSRATVMKQRRAWIRGRSFIWKTYRRRPCTPLDRICSLKSQSLANKTLRCHWRKGEWGGRRLQLFARRILAVHNEEFARRPCFECRRAAGWPGAHSSGRGGPPLTAGC